MIGWIVSITLVICIIILYNIQKKKKKEIQLNIEQKYLEEKRKEIEKKIDAEKSKAEDELTLYRQMVAAKKNTLDAEFAMQEAAVREKQSSATKLFDAEIAKQNELLAQKQREAEAVIAQLEQRKKDLEQAYQESVATQQKRIDKELLDWETLRIFKLDQEYDKHKQEIIAKTTAETQEFIAQCEEKKTQIAADLANIEDTLNEYRKKRQVINEEILRQRALEEQQDFYRIVLPSAAIDDIQLLLSVRENLKQRENLDKLIYEAYISKPTQEMIKRVLEGRAPSGIYKITRLKTGEIYIGKSTDIKKRWGEHSKTAYGVGTIAHSTLHTTIKKDGIQNFTFELLEEVPKDKLTEREKYWITFYDSKNYGLNERNG